MFPLLARMLDEHGEVAEWFKAAVLKTVELERVPGVRIPSSPPAYAHVRFRLGVSFGSAGGVGRARFAAA
jgi:hypothetical protein